MAHPVFDVVPVEGREVQIGLLLSVLEATTIEWRRELGVVGRDAVVWQPVEN